MQISEMAGIKNNYLEVKKTIDQLYFDGGDGNDKDLIQISTRS